MNTTRVKNNATIRRNRRHNKIANRVRKSVYKMKRVVKIMDRILEKFVFTWLSIIPFGIFAFLNLRDISYMNLNPTQTIESLESYLILEVLYVFYFAVKNFDRDFNK